MFHQICAKSHESEVLCLYFEICMGVLRTVLVALGCGIPAWLVGQQELKQFKAGVYAGRGKGEITAGYIFGILGVVLSLLSIVAFIVLIVQGISLGANDPSAF